MKKRKLNYEISRLLSPDVPHGERISERELAEVLAFAIEQDIYVFDIIHPDQHNRLMEIASKLVEGDVLVATYPYDRKSRMEFRILPFTDSERSPTFTLNADMPWRRHFPAGRKGDKPNCLRKLRQWALDYPDVTDEMIENATVFYIAYCKREEQTIRHADNYICDENGKSMLSSMIEEIQVREEDISPDEQSI